MLNAGNEENNKNKMSFQLVFSINKNGDIQ